MDEQELKEKKKEADRPRYREFTVTPGMCGFKVKIGCSEAYFEDVFRLGRAISDYLIDPQGVEKCFLGNDIRYNTAPLPGRIEPIPAPEYASCCAAERAQTMATGRPL
jgi:hypothetical protein